jgi:cardiolipin synthase
MHSILLLGLVVAALAASFAAAGHALLWKRDPRAALGWIVTSLALPVVGPLLYFIFGINRIQTRAKMLPITTVPGEADGDPALHHADLPPEFSELAGIARAVSTYELTAGNRIEVLHNGEQAFPAMLRDIEAATDHVFLSTYIFENNETGRAFVDALARASGRGVDTRVIVDGVGELYSLPRVSRLLAKRGVRVERFFPPRLVPPMLHINLRNHRKLLITDGRLAFTGGMNIGDRHLANRTDNPDRVLDTHFRFEGPVVGQLQRVFLDSWAFVSRQEPDQLPSDDHAAGTALCRTIIEGPDEDLDKLLSVLLVAVSAAREQVAIMTPYFVPPRELVGALKSAALRGVDVAVILPGRNNLPFVQWASRNMLWELLQRGVRVYLQPPPFVHTKLLMVDRHYVQVGSANIDPRSLRLNFELVVEIYDRDFAATIDAHFRSARRVSREITLEEVDSRPVPARIRDALAWLLTPYL